ncbi:MAG: MGMT family protein [Patescibacteria group bacterium]
MKSFKEKKFSVVAKIPKGETLTYKGVARRAGNAKASRAVGNILSKNYDPKVPCHRVIRNDRKPGGYNRGATTKIRILRAEGVKIAG